MNHVQKEYSNSQWYTGPETSVSQSSGNITPVFELRQEVRRRVKKWWRGFAILIEVFIKKLILADTETTSSIGGRKREEVESTHERTILCRKINSSSLNYQQIISGFSTKQQSRFHRYMLHQNQFRFFPKELFEFTLFFSIGLQVLRNRLPAKKIKFLRRFRPNKEKLIAAIL